MDDYLADVINRICDTSDQDHRDGFDSSKTISWKASREAEKLANKDFIPQLIDFLNRQKDKKKRDKTYFILGQIAKNTNDITALNYLIYRVEKETDKYIISSLLTLLGNIKKPMGTDLQPLIRATKNDKWLIRHSAIQSLKHSDDPIAESALIEILATHSDNYDIIYANATLNKMGTIKSIPYLEKHLTSRTRDVKHSAKLAIEEINKRHGRTESTTANTVFK